MTRRAGWRPKRLKAAAILEAARARRIMLSVEDVTKAAGVSLTTMRRWKELV